MRIAISYLLVLLIVNVYAFIYPLMFGLPEWLVSYQAFYYCSLSGLLGGIFYCLRGIYKTYCVNENWSDRWLVWYFIRPIVSMIAGSISYVFLKAGLLVLDAETSVESSQFGYVALAFIAGLNVDNFTKKIESIAKSAWGINESRMSKKDD